LQERNSALAGGLEREHLCTRFFRNIKYSWRMLRRNPGLTTAVVATLALGIGATTAIYTVIYATLLSPLPLPHPERLVMVWSKVQGNRNGIAAGDFLDWQRYSTSFQNLCAFTGGNFNLGTKDKPEQVEGRLASPGFFGMMGLPLMLGRDFLPQEGVPGNDKVVILTHKLVLLRSLSEHRSRAGRCCF